MKDRFEKYLAERETYLGKVVRLGRRDFMQAAGMAAAVAAASGKVLPHSFQPVDVVHADDAEKSFRFAYISDSHLYEKKLNERFVRAILKAVDDVNALDPQPDFVLYGGDLGTARIYKISDNQNRTAGRNDTNRLKEFERQPGPVTAVAFSPDGNAVALGSINEVRVYDAGESNKRLATLSGHNGPVYAVAYSPDGAVIATGGFDGNVRLFDAKSGNLIKQFPSVPLKAADKAAAPAAAQPKPDEKAPAAAPSHPPLQKAEAK